MGFIKDKYDCNKIAFACLQMSEYAATKKAADIWQWRRDFIQNIRYYKYEKLTYKQLNRLHEIIADLKCEGLL